MSVKCECNHLGVLDPAMAIFYDPITELPYVNHEPHECRCTNNLMLYVRDGKEMWLCSICCIQSDREVTHAG